MATKQTQNENLVVYDELLQGKESNVRIVVEIPKIESNARAYHQALKHSRNIPFDLEAINPLDKMYQYTLEKLPHLKGKPDVLRDKVRNFYEQLSAGAYRDAVMLSVIAHKENKFDFEPLPYEEDESFLEDNDLPGLIGPPKITPDITDPTEYRLKQFYDWLKANPEQLIKLQPAFELAVIKVNELAVSPKTDADGFRPKPTA